MYDVSVLNLKKMVGIEQQVTIHKHNHKTINGKLIGISIDHIIIYDSIIKAEVEILNRDISHITFKSNNPDTVIDNIQLANFKRRCERNAEESSISIGLVYKSYLERYIECSSFANLKNYIKTEIEGRGAKYSMGEYEEFYEYWMHEDKKKSLQKNTIYIIDALLLFRLRRYSHALSSLMQYSEVSSPTDLFLLLSCFFGCMKNHMGTLFWIERHYMSMESLPENDNKWWFYLRLVSKYSCYENVINLLKVKACSSPKTALRSLAYLLVANNNVGVASQLLDMNHADLRTDEVWQIIDRNSHFLISDNDNNYHRYLKCIDHILNEDVLYQYEEDDDITGYVYDYVPDREFGFIIGFDLISYFFRKESIISERINKDIKNNICAMMSVDDEELVLVTFKRSSETKRSYNAIEIV